MDGPRYRAQCLSAGFAGVVVLCSALTLAACERSESAQATPPGAIARGVTLRYWAPRWTESLRAEDATGLALYRKLEQFTGIHVEFTFPTSGLAQGQLEQLKA